MSLNKYIQLCNHHHNHNIEQFQHPNKLFQVLCGQPFQSPSGPGKHNIHLFSVLIVFPFPES